MTTTQRPIDVPVRVVAGFGVATGVVVAAIDVALVLSATFSGDPVAYVGYAVALTGFVGACVGGLFGLWHSLVGWAARRWSAGRSVSVALRAVPLAALACGLVTPWIAARWGHMGLATRALVVLGYSVTVAGSFAAFWASSELGARYARFRRLPPWHWPLVAACALVAWTLHWADGDVLVGLYPELHVAFAAGFVLATALGVVLVCRAVRVGRSPGLDGPWRHAAVVAAFGAALVVFEALRPDVFGDSSARVVSKLIAAGRAATDFDRDGSSSFFGGLDCDAFDPRVGPAAFDLPGNGIDEDCDGRELVLPPPLPAATHDVPDVAGFNLLFITVDALRADHLGFHGYGRPTSANLDALAARSVVFDNAFAQATSTVASVPSIMTGVYPGNLPRDYDIRAKGAAYRSVFEVGDDTAVLAELLGRRGYDTTAYLRFDVLLGLGRGFGTFEAEYRRLVEKSVEHLGRVEEPFFTWVHLADPHSPYEKYGSFDFGDSDLDRYDSEIAEADEKIGRLLSALETRDLDRRTIVVVTADHGEEFREHGGQYHREVLHEELLHVPLVLHVPGVEARRVPTVVELVDIVPTLNELLALAHDADAFDGQSLFASIAGHRAEGQRGAYSEIVVPRGPVTKKSLRTARWRAIWDLGGGPIQLFDRRADPREQRDVAADHPRVVDDMRRRLLARPMRRAGAVFRDYARTGDLTALVARLGVLQQPRLVDAALALLSRQHLSNGARADLERLRSRRGLSEKQRSEVGRLLATLAH